MLPPRPGFDPRLSSETVLSASRLEALGACPLRYFYRYVLRVAPPDDPEYQPDAWLSALHRGSLLHGVYERLLRVAREEGLGPDAGRFLELGVSVLEAHARALREEVPPPSDSVYRRELEALEVDVRCFVDHLREHPAPWAHLERQFGFAGGGEPPVVLEIGGGAVRLRGAIDRIDDAGADSGGLRIVDYKTGYPGRKWARATGVWDGGRRLQHVLYTLAIEALEGREVASMEYHFPTLRGEGEIRAFPRRTLEDGPPLLARLLDAAARGRFVPSDDAGDCAYCDYQPVCRVVESDRGGRSSPPTAWARARIDEGSPAYEDLTRVRGWGE
jgi:ATP-dependent helicase/nuclease subunit B